MDTFERVEESLKVLLSDHDYKVIALTGKWGTGKTHLWKSLSHDPEISSQKPIYVSAFGAKSSSEIKLRILQNAYLQDSKGTQKVLHTLGNVAAGWLRKATGADVESAALAWLPKLVEGRLIAVDDIERKHRSFDIDELLGFLDEYTETHTARFVVLMNSDNLPEGDKELLKILHEKVIDAHVVLDPSSAEALALLGLSTSQPHKAHACEAVQALGLNNIRIIRRILKVIDQVEQAINVEGIPTARWVPGVVLLTASHYRANDKLPPWGYFKSYNTFSRIVQEQAPTDPRHADWNATLERLGIASADEFELILQEFLDTGFLDRERLKALFAGYRKEARTATTSGRVHELVRAMWWEPQRSTTELLAEARNLLKEVDQISPSDITDVSAAVSDLGDASLAEDLIERWVATADSRPEYQLVGEGDFEDVMRPLHPQVHSKLREIRDRQHPPLSLRDVIQRIRRNSGWGERERIGLRSSTVQDYVHVLTSIGGAELRQFLAEHLAWLRQGPPDESFKIGVDNFVAACRQIRDTEPESRLTKRLENSFRSNGVFAQLVPVGPGQSVAL